MISLVSEYTVVFDACVLLPITLCDLFLRLAEEPALYRPKWSPHILDEISRNLQGSRFAIPKAKAEYRIACMQSAFPEAMITDYESLIDAMPNNPKDRHVMAAAVKGDANCIVTTNLRHFPREQMRERGLDVRHPDEFLVHQLALDAVTVRRKTEECAASRREKLDSFLNNLAKSTPAFVRELRAIS